MTDLPDTPHGAPPAVTPRGSAARSARRARASSRGYTTTHVVLSVYEYTLDRLLYIERGGRGRSPSCGARGTKRRTSVVCRASGRGWVVEVLVWVVDRRDGCLECVQGRWTGKFGPRSRRRRTPDTVPRCRFAISIPNRQAQTANWSAAARVHTRDCGSAHPLPSVRASQAIPAKKGGVKVGMQATGG